MHRKCVAAIAFAILLLGITGVSAQDSRTLIWQRWDVVIDNVDTVNNVYRVTEHYEIEFRGTFSFGVRDIEHDMLEDIENIRITDRGKLARQLTSPTTLLLRLRAAKASLRSATMSSATC